MKRLAFLIDENDFVSDSIVVDSENEYVDGKIIAVSPPLGTSFYKMKWNGNEWVEGETEEELSEREAVIQLENFLPSPNEVADAELELKLIALLTELEVII